MVDKLILLDALPVVLDMNVRTGLARPVSLGVWVPGSVFSPAPLGGYQGGRRRWQTVDKRAQGPPPPPPRAGLCYLFPRSGQQTGSRACVILGGPACGLESTEGQVDHNGRGGRGEEQ